MSPLETLGVLALGLIGVFAALVLIAAIGAPLFDRRVKGWQARAQRLADERRAEREEHDAYLAALGRSERRAQRPPQSFPERYVEGDDFRTPRARLECIPDPLEVAYGLPAFDPETAR